LVALLFFWSIIIYMKPGCIFGYFL